MNVLHQIKPWFDKRIANMVAATARGIPHSYREPCEECESGRSDRCPYCGGFGTVTHGHTVEERMAILADRVRGRSIDPDCFDLKRLLQTPGDVAGAMGQAVGE